MNYGQVGAIILDPEGSLYAGSWPAWRDHRKRKV